MKAFVAICRVVQIISAAVVLGLSVNLAKGQLIGHVPATTGYGSFCGGFGIIAAAIGICGLFVPILGGVIGWAVDALCALVLLAGGIALAVGIRGTQCSGEGNVKTYENSLLNCGWTTVGGKPYTGCDQGTILSRCKQATADDVFLFLGCFATLVALALSFIGGKDRVGGSYV